MSDIEVTCRGSRPPGGQHAGPDRNIIVCVRHRPTGVYVEVPSGLLRSQHKARIVAMEAIEWITGVKP